MREIIARTVCAFAVCVVVALALFFAWKHNPPLSGDAERGTSSLARAADVQGNTERGRQVYAEQNCATCHSIAGVGNPRHPLDSVGAHGSAEEMRERITATGSAEAQLPGSVVRRKSRYRELTTADLDALTAYILSSRVKR